MKIAAVGGAQVRIPGPAFALEAKMSGATRGAILTYSPSEGLNLVLDNSARVKDWPDFTSTARGIARDLYKPVTEDIEGLSGNPIIQSMRTTRAETAEHLSEISQVYAERNAPATSAMYGEFGQDILKGVNRNPQPLHTLTPGMAGAGVVAGASLIGLTAVVPGALKLVFLGLAGEFRPTADEIYKIRTSASDIKGELYERLSTGKEIISPAGIMGQTRYDAIGRTRRGTGESTYTNIQREQYQPIIASRNYQSLYPGTAADESYPKIVTLTDYPRSSLLTEVYPAAAPSVVTTLYPALQNPEVYPASGPQIVHAVPLPQGWRSGVPPEIIAPVSMSASLRQWTPALDWHLERRKKHPFRFVELFSFEIPTEKSPVPYRYGKGGPLGALKNPQLAYLEGPATPAKKILQEEAYGLAGFGPVMRLKESIGIKNLRRDRL